MDNLKHTIAAGLAFVMISSLTAIQTVSMISAKADNVQANTSSYILSSTNWDDSLINKTALLSSTEQSSAPVEQPAIDTSIGYVIVSEGALNVRSGASTDSEILDQLNCGEKVSIIENLSDWYLISYGNEGKTGYVTSVSITHNEEEANAAVLKSFMYQTGTAVVSDGALNIRSGAGTDFEVVNQIDNGEQVIILGEENGWLQVYYGKNYEIGYVICDSIQISGTISKDEVAQKKSERVASSAKSKGKISISTGALNIRSTASENGEVIAQIANKSDVLILDTNSGWTKIAFGSNNTIGYAKSDYIIDASMPSRSSTARTSSASTNSSTNSSTSNSSKTTKTTKTKSVEPVTNSSGSSSGQAVVEEAKKYLGTKYVYGGSSPSGFDCSGLVQYVYRQLGISVGRSSRDQFNNGVAVSRENLQPGDLVFFKSGGTISHVGIYAGNGQMIHSPQTGKTVTHTSINSTSRTRSYAGARRIVG